MIELDDRTENIIEVSSQSPVIEPPKIQSEEDIPFDASRNVQENTSQDKLSKTDSLDDQITRFKYLTGKKVLYISMGAMGAAVIISI